MNYIVPSGYKQLGEDEGDENLGIGFSMFFMKSILTFLKTFLKRAGRKIK